MDRFHLAEMLHLHEAFDLNEEAMRNRIASFVGQYEQFHSRSLTVGHVTASAWIIDEDCSHTLLLHHGKLHKWLQPGGHVEDDADILAAARREAHEETGLADFHPLSETIFDVDVHEIPSRPGEPDHFHYDIRFAFVASRNAPLVVSAESRSLAWVPLTTITELTQEESILRMVRKTARLKKRQSLKYSQ